MELSRRFSVQSPRCMLRIPVRRLCGASRRRIWQRRSSWCGYLRTRLRWTWSMVLQIRENIMVLNQMSYSAEEPDAQSPGEPEFPVADGRSLASCKDRVRYDESFDVEVENKDREIHEVASRRRPPRLTVQVACPRSVVTAALRQARATNNLALTFAVPWTPSRENQVDSDQLFH